MEYSINVKSDYHPTQQLVADDPARFKVVAAGRRWGKLEPLFARIPTPDGWTTMGDIRVGDQVLGHDGKPTTVTYVTPTTVRPAYRLTFNDGTEVITADTHDWTAFNHTARKQYARDTGGYQYDADWPAWRDNKYRAEPCQTADCPNKTSGTHCPGHIRSAARGTAGTKVAAVERCIWG